MDDIVRIAALSLTETETEIYNNIEGAIIKTIALNNTTESPLEVTLNIDNVAFFIPLEAKETKFLESVLVVNNLKAKGLGINIHISGIQLGGV